MKNILDFDREQLKEIMTELGEKPFRAAQVFGWLSGGVSSFEQMTNVPRSLIDKLSADYYIGLPKIIVEQKSKTDGTRKVLYEFEGGRRVESVFMKYGYGNSICISSQVGCRMGCSFCASTISGLDSNLSAGEMLAEVLAMRNLTGEDIRHVVVMGMGEPFDNYDNLSAFLRLIHDEKGYDLSYRNITVSTCGLIPCIRRFGDDFPQVGLAVSLHAPNDRIRSRIMPVARKYNYDSLLAVCREYAVKTGRRITFEYSMINGVNDSESDAKELSSKLSGWLTHVNLIPLNQVQGRDYLTSEQKNIRRFKSILEQNGIAVTVRRTLGADIDAACGQLRQR